MNESNRKDPSKKSTTPGRKKFFLQALVLWLAGTLSYLAIIPYILTLRGPKFAEQIESLGMSVNQIFILSTLQQSLILGLFVVLGLFCAKKVGLKAPLSAHLVGIEKLNLKNWFKTVLKPAFLWALFLGSAILILHQAMSPWLPESLKAIDKSINPTWWQGLLGAFYGGIGEEILMRLGFLSLITFLLNKIFKKKEGSLSNRFFWTANIIAALLFGLGHLPATAAITALTPMVIFRALLLNGIPGLAFGNFYRWYGLEAAMICHFSTDIVLHVLPKLLPLT